MTANKYLLGIDTGGTYTDAAIIDPAERRVIATAKALTTKGDLAVGVGEAMRVALAALPASFRRSDIALVSVSTTLATNAVVEGHGGAVGTILIGFDAAMATRSGIASSYADMPVQMIGGGHDHNGEPRAPLDRAALAIALSELDPRVEAYAVAATFAVRNAEHELEARALITARTGKPVTISTELASALDAPRRALTAALNARLISRISALIAAVRRAMAQEQFVCPLMIVRGDGTLALADTVAARPIETVLSGPAASLVGAHWLCGLDDFIMSDMGGTTTDLGVLSGGRPRVSEEGAEVGGWRTMVKAIDVKTIGLGGDSEVVLGLNGVLSVGPARVVPVSLLAHRYPEVLGMLDGDLGETDGGSMLGKFVVRPFGGEGAASPSGLSAREADVLALVSARPQPLRRIALTSGAQRALVSLRRRGLVQLASFTPSDAGHILDLQSNWSRDAAWKAAELMVRFREMKAPTPARVEAFAREVWSETVRLTGQLILETAFGRKLASDGLVDAVCRGEGQVGLARVALTPSVPVVAVGGPVRVFYGEVGRRLGAEIVYPPHCDVANAVGAAAGAVACRVVVQVDGDGGGLFRVLSAAGARSFDNGFAALAEAETIARVAAERQLFALGAAEADIRVTIEKHLLPDAVDDNGLFKATVTADAAGRPRF